MNDGLFHRYASHPGFTGTGALSYTSFAIPRHEREGASVFLLLSFNPSWADPALLRFAFVTALLAFRLRGEQLPLLALPRKRAAGFPSVLPTCLSRFSGHGPHAGLVGRQQDFMYARSPSTPRYSVASVGDNRARGIASPLYSACGGVAPTNAWADPAERYADVTALEACRVRGEQKP